MENSQFEWWANGGTLVDEETLARICCIEETSHASESANMSQTLTQFHYRSIIFLWDLLSVSSKEKTDQILRVDSFHDLCELVCRIGENRFSCKFSQSTEETLINVVEQEQMFMACLGIMSVITSRGFFKSINLSALVDQLKNNDPIQKLDNGARTMIAGILHNVALLSKDGVEKIAALMRGQDLATLLNGANQSVIDQLTRLLLGGNSIDTKLFFD